MLVLNVVVHIGRRNAKAREKLLRKSQQLEKEGKSGEIGKRSEVRLKNRVPSTALFLCSKSQAIKDTIIELDVSNICERAGVVGN
ncbi:BgTH12-01121 [Blumeria graminis f. sp. triticale]|uniref:BgTH12-01121 n=1 Tax=Blumeria graminis f. sp. triticale TaxID=1689686 RepID=A0A9W4DS82_BLUGR|nr:BgTH12-01121 [Blumeria graminis f. sp. triticale]